MVAFHSFSFWSLSLETHCHVRYTSFPRWHLDLRVPSETGRWNKQWYLCHPLHSLTNRRLNLSTSEILITNWPTSIKKKNLLIFFFLKSFPAVLLSAILRSLSFGITQFFEVSQASNILQSNLVWSNPTTIFFFLFFSINCSDRLILHSSFRSFCQTWNV